jgi:hypothetical protein
MVCYEVSSHNLLFFYRYKGGDGDNRYRYTPRGHARTLSFGGTDLVAAVIFQWHQVGGDFCLQSFHFPFSSYRGIPVYSSVSILSDFVYNTAIVLYHITPILISPHPIP